MTNVQFEIDAVSRAGLRRTRVAGSLRQRFATSSAVWCGAAFLVAVVVAGFVAPAVSGYSTSDFVALPLQPPSWQHLFGTDQYGRDLLVRVLAAARVDYLIGLFVVISCGILGSAIGVLAATTRLRGVDWAVNRVVDAVIAFPFTVLVLAIAVIVGADTRLFGLPAGLPSLLIVYALTGWAYYARLARAQVLSLRSRDYIRAARLMGFSDVRITLRHLFPQVLLVTLAYAVGDAIVAIALTASLSFLGAGIAPPTPEWGQIMYEGRTVIGSAWWVVGFPAAMLALSGIAFVLVTDGITRRIEGL